jgi:hypothetical protein
MIREKGHISIPCRNFEIVDRIELILLTNGANIQISKSIANPYEHRLKMILLTEIINLFTIRKIVPSFLNFFNELKIC